MEQSLPEATLRNRHTGTANPPISTPTTDVGADTTTNATNDLPPLTGVKSSGLERKSSTSLRRMSGDVKAQQVVSVDIKVSSTDALQRAIDSLTCAIDDRKAKATCDTHRALLDKQITHIEREFAGQISTEMETTALPFSLEHLELYQAFLQRTTFPELGPDNLQERHEVLSVQVDNMLAAHPLAQAPRSGDTNDNQHGSAYFKVPWGRRRQTMVMIYLNLLTGPSLIFATIAFLMYVVPYSYVFMGLYIAWVTYDNKTRPMPCPERMVASWRHHYVYQLFRDYFPIRLIKATQPTVFDKEKNYLYCYHPHGVQSAGAFSFASSATGFDHLFPHLTCSVQTLSINYAIPFTRENLIALGLGDASKGCLIKTLTSKPGSSAMLVTGGALESLYTHPYSSKVVLKTRAGFVKVALQSGASLVPVWGFGENNLYENLAEGNSRLRKWQRRIQRAITFAPLLVHGRGVFTYSGGLLPRRRPISVVVGNPIHLERCEQPTKERVQEVHKLYKEALMDLFNTYKDIYDPKAEPIEYI